MKTIKSKTIKSFIFSAVAVAASFSLSACVHSANPTEYDTTVENAESLVLEEGTYDLVKVTTYVWEDETGTCIYAENIEVTVTSENVSEVTVSEVDTYTEKATYEEEEAAFSSYANYTFDDENLTVTITFTDTEKEDSKTSDTLENYKESFFTEKETTSSQNIEYTNISVNQSEDKKTITRKVNVQKFASGKSSAAGDEPTNTYTVEWTYTKRQ